MLAKMVPAYMALFRFASDVLPPKATMTLLAATLMLVTMRHGGIKALVRCGT